MFGLRCGDDAESKNVQIKNVISIIEFGQMKMGFFCYFTFLIFALEGS